MSVSVVSPVFIGRRDEIAALGGLLDRATAKDPAFALIGGEAGVGKTRLLRELTTLAADQGCCVLTGQCVELGAEGLPLAPLVDALRTLARTMPPDVLTDVLGPAGPGLSRLLPELAPAAPAPPATPAGPAGEDMQKAQLLELVLGTLDRLSGVRPVLFAIEDLHWADRSTLDLVAFLFRSLRNAAGAARGHLPVRRAAPAAPVAPAADQLGARPVDRQDRPEALRPRRGRRPAERDPRPGSRARRHRHGVRPVGRQRLPGRGAGRDGPGRRRR